MLFKDHFSVSFEKKEYIYNNYNSNFKRNLKKTLHSMDAFSKNPLRNVFLLMYIKKNRQVQFGWFIVGFG